MGKLIKIPKELLPRIAPTRFCYGLEARYQKYLDNMLKQWFKKADQIWKYSIIPIYKQTAIYQDDDSNDNVADQLKASMQYLEVQLESGMNDIVVEAWVKQFIKDVDQWSYNGLKIQIAPRGIDPISTDRFLRQYTQSKIAENVSRITTLHDQYAQQVESTIFNGVTKGQGTHEIAQQIYKIDSATREHAELIARDQTGSILGQINAHRQQEAGADYYIWQTMEDARVREAHQELDQTLQRYGDPDGGDGGMVPGEPIRCRCVALPVFEDELEEYRKQGLLAA
ncbi:phage minor head protein [Lentilactobacillus sunkii]|uniref:Phage head morphogenesis protein n=1 Tax=Lentilactobacillus sunkii DSM 19904 TaxID=1423808 RepID=A0A0R1L1J2_9LACO|nr:phage minor head protein [Lentilactobacillus sunkii]KRK87555.1 phage head morphogenesis protein [Lentilactobacillus sunkii DSM 19904]